MEITTKIKYITKNGFKIWKMQHCKKECKKCLFKNTACSNFIENRWVGNKDIFSNDLLNTTVKIIIENNSDISHFTNEEIYNSVETFLKYENYSLDVGNTYHKIVYLDEKKSSDNQISIAIYPKSSKIFFNINIKDPTLLDSAKEVCGNAQNDLNIVESILKFEKSKE